MNFLRKLYLVVLLLTIASLQMMAQQKITGRVIDEDGYPVSYASVQYKGHKIAVSSDGQGKFTIEKKPGLMLTVTALSYRTETVKVDEKTTFLEVKLKDDTHKLTEVATMKQDEIDKIIAEAVAENKGRRKKKWHKAKGGDGVSTARKVLNWAFMLGFAAALVIYFVMPEAKLRREPSSSTYQNQQAA